MKVWDEFLENADLPQEDGISTSDGNVHTLVINITEHAQRIIDGSSEETKVAVRILIAFLAKKMHKSEELEVLEWYAPYLYFEVRDRSWKHYPCYCRALVSFDTTNNQIASYRSENRYQFARSGWIKTITKLLGYEATKYNDCGNKSITHSH